MSRRFEAAHGVPEDSSLVTQIEIRVRYAETDQMRVAHHANYLIWFEAVRTEFCRERGLDYKSIEERGLFLPIIEVSCRYFAPARYDDVLTVTAYVVERKRSTMRVGYLIECGETKVATGETTSALMDGMGRLRSFPPEVAALFDP